MALCGNPLKVFEFNIEFQIFNLYIFRYYPEEIEMYQFDNGFKLDKKVNNWEHL